MKYIYSFLVVVIISSCLDYRKDTDKLHTNYVEETQLILPETVLLDTTDEGDDTTQYYSYSYRTGSDVIYYGAYDLNFLLTDTSIKTLSLSGGTYHDLSPLAGLSLKSLSLSGGTYHDLSPLAMLTELEELSITSNDYITDISPIGFLINLKKLSLNNYCRIESIAPISSLTNLIHLELLYDDRYYRELASLQQLEFLMLRSESNERWDASYIAQLQSLKELYIATGPISNIEQLKNLINLEKLFIGYFGLDISWLIHLQKLTELELRVNRIDDISPLLELPNLVDVGLYKTVIRDLRPLSESKSIKRVTGFILESGTSELDLDSLFWDRGIECIPYSSDR